MPDKWIWQPGREWIEETNVFRFMRRLGFENREDFLRFSRDELETFWDRMVQETGIEWSVPYTQVLDTSRGVEWSRWFINGKLNVAQNCLDRHASKLNSHLPRGAGLRPAMPPFLAASEHGGPESRHESRLCRPEARSTSEFSQATAILWEGEDQRTRTITFAQLHEEVCRLASGLRSLGLQPGGRVGLVMPMVPEAVTILYACFKLGLIAVPIFAGFGWGAIATRLEDAGARVVFTADATERRGKLTPLKAKLDKIASMDKVIVLNYKGTDVPWNESRDVWWDDFVSGPPAECASLPLDSESTAMILYTSGTTGQPKGTVHTHAGSLAQTSKEIWLGFDHKPDDRFFWLSDIGWMMAPWAIIGNHNFGGTIFMYDGAPDHPTPDRLWQMIERHRITTLGISPTAIRLLMQTSSPEQYAMRSLRLLGSTGEPWDESSYMWFFEKIGKRHCPVINISGGTEIVGSFLFPLPIQPLKPCTLGGPAPGMATEVVDEDGEPVRGRTGYLVCTKPAPSMTRGIWGDPQRYVETYWSRFKGMWNHGDWASVDEDGCWFLHGRADESLKVAGRKLGPAEIEQTLMGHPSVAEAAVVGVPDAIKGEAIVAFVVPARELNVDELSAYVVERLGPTFRPNAIHVVKELPKTQSGKVVRRLLRQAFLGEPLGDLSTVANPDALKW